MRLITRCDNQRAESALSINSTSSQSYQPPFRTDDSISASMLVKVSKGVQVRGASERARHEVRGVRELLLHGAAVTDGEDVLLARLQPVVHLRPTQRRD